MWSELVAWSERSMLDPRLELANAEDIRIPRCLETADEAIAAVRELQRAWAASRSV